MSNKEAFFADVDVFAFASKSEGFGIVVLEAMEAGKPSVVTDIPPLNSIIVPGISGLVATPDDPASFAAAIVSLFREPRTLHTMGDEARRRVEAAFSPAAMVDKTVAYYGEVMRTRAASA
jgi:glycosyltransferase involved in cell wall biosynthesis